MEKSQNEKIFEYFIKTSKKNFGYNILKESTYINTHKNFPELKDKNFDLFKFKIKKISLNKNKKLHNGVLATLIDKLTSFTLHLKDEKHRGSVTIELNLNFIRDSFLNQEIFFLCKIDKMSHTMGYSYCEVYDEFRNVLCRAYHVKFFIKGTYELPKL